MGLKLRSIDCDCTACSSTIDSSKGKVGAFILFISGIQTIILDAILFIDRFGTQNCHNNRTTDLIIPQGLSYFLRYFIEYFQKTFIYHSSTHISRLSNFKGIFIELENIKLKSMVFCRLNKTFYENKKGTFAGNTNIYNKYIKFKYQSD